MVDASDGKQFAYLLESYLQFAPSNDRANTFTSAHKMALGQHLVGDSKPLVRHSDNCTHSQYAFSVRSAYRCTRSTPRICSNNYGG